MLLRAFKLLVKVHKDFFPLTCFFFLGHWRRASLHQQTPNQPLCSVEHVYTLIRFLLSVALFLLICNINRKQLWKKSKQLKMTTKQKGKKYTSQLLREKPTRKGKEILESQPRFLIRKFQSLHLFGEHPRFCVLFDIYRCCPHVNLTDKHQPWTTHLDTNAPKKNKSKNPFIMEFPFINSSE